MPHRLILWLSLLLAVLLALVWLNLQPYQGNPSALFNIDERLASEHPIPQGTVILKVPGYDGMQYYQIARMLPLFLSQEGRIQLANTTPLSYAYQRILLPVTAFALAFGQTSLLPYSFLLINIGSLVVTSWLLLAFGKKPLYALALSLCPAAMVALHFSLAEPLAIALLSLFLLRYERTKTIRFLDPLLLSALVLSREINILFVLATLGFFCLKQQWRFAALLLVPIAIFVSWHAILFSVFHNIPFLSNPQQHHAFPFSAIFHIAWGSMGYNKLTLTSLLLFLFFVAPALLIGSREILKTRKLSYIPLMLLFFIGIMLLMPEHIWGSVTSIGRVITPVYPLFVLTIARHDRISDKIAAISLLGLGLFTAVGLAISIHPFFIA